MLQRADGGRWGAPDHRRDSGGATGQDQGQLVGMLDEINETFGVDGGLLQRAGSVGAGRSGIDAHVALGREGKSQVAVDPARLPATHRMGEKLASPAGKARYAQRKWLSEAPNGWIKEGLGFRRFSLRGLAKVDRKSSIPSVARPPPNRLLNIKTSTAHAPRLVCALCPSLTRHGALRWQPRTGHDNHRRCEAHDRLTAAAVSVSTALVPAPVLAGD